MDPTTEGEAADVTARLEFLLATRVRYELHQRPDRLAAEPAASSETEAEPISPDQELRAAEFLVATRALRETNERAFRAGGGSTSD
jgi:hypothetical protein